MALTRQNLPPLPLGSYHDGLWWRNGSLDDLYQAYIDRETTAGRQPLGFVSWVAHRDILGE